MDDGMLDMSMLIPHPYALVPMVWLLTKLRRAAIDESFWAIAVTYEPTVRLEPELELLELELLELDAVEVLEDEEVLATAPVASREETSALGGLTIPNMPFSQ